MAQNWQQANSSSSKYLKKYFYPYSQTSIIFNFPVLAVFLKYFSSLELYTSESNAKTIAHDAVKQKRGNLMHLKSQNKPFSSHLPTSIIQSQDKNLMVLFQ